MKAPIAIFLAIALAGCGKKNSGPPEAARGPVDPAQSTPEESPTTVQSTAVAAPLAQPETPRAVPIPAVQAPSAQTAALEGAIHAVMTMALHKFIRENGRMPKDFSEFAGASMDSVPFAPEGMEYAIDYANKQVKVVKIKKK